MNADFLNRLYIACSAEESPSPDGSNLGELYQRTEDSQKASRCFSEKLEACGLSQREKDLLDNLSGSLAMAYEQQGFVNGFRLGLKLAEELRDE